MRSRVARIPSLREYLIAVLILHRLIAVPFIHLIRGVVGVDLVWTVVFIVGLALRALHAGLDLGTHANTISNFAGSDFGANSDDLSDDFMTDTERCYLRISVPLSGPVYSLGLTLRSPQPPVMVWTSDPQTPQHSFTISTS